MVVKFSDLSNSDLLVNEIYKGGTVRGKGSEVLSKLISGISNSGGFRFQTKDGIQNLCLLFANNNKSAWQNSFDPNTGVFIYHGDNNEVGISVQNSTKSGMKFLNRINEAIQQGRRKDVPPILIFVKGYKGWDVRFVGLAVPGVEGNNQEFLKVVTTTEGNGQVQNYRATFTVLDIEKISREWIDDLKVGNGYESYHIPVEWKQWVDSNIYNPIKGKVDSFGLQNQDDLSQIVLPAKKVVEVSNMELVNHIYKCISSKGFLYSEENIKNLYLSLLSKPFVILSGISGTGKTKIVELFAEAVGATYENGRFKLIPVRPDWSDSSDLLGYKDLKNDFIQGPLTKMIIRAEENPDYPHFVVLDEMNLARVEYYLSDFLSVIESRKFNGKKIETAPIVEFDGKSYGIPDNLYIIGTVNMDETTHPFSKKVLDRANTIEFNEVHLMNLSFFEDAQVEIEPIEVTNDLFKTKYIQLPDAAEYLDVIKEVSEELEQINAILATIYAHVGYRVRDEISFYMSYNEEFNLMSRDEAMDFCIMQKILPRISGAGQEVEETLDNLLKLFTGESSSLDTDSNLFETAKYPRSVTKLKEMKARYGTQGFVSYWIS